MPIFVNIPLDLSIHIFHFSTSAIANVLGKHFIRTPKQTAKQS